MAKARTVQLSLKVKVPGDMKISDAKVASLVNQMLDVGYADAADSADDRDIDNPDANDVTKLTFGKPKVVKV